MLPGTAAAGLAFAIAAVFVSQQPASVEGIALDPGPGIVVARVPRCGECSIEFEKIAELGLEDDATMAVGARAYGGARRLYALDLIAGHQIRIFDHGGRLIRLFGRQGEGPGEFRQITSVVEGPGDTLHVFDERNVRWTVLSPRFELARTVRLPLRPSFEAPVLIGDGGILVNPARGVPLVHVSPGGVVERRFGERREGVQRPRSAPGNARILSSSLRGGLWVALPEVYRIEAWSSEGEFLYSLISHPEWMKAERTLASEGKVRAPVPSILSMQQTDDGLLWASIRVADADWEGAVEDGRVTNTAAYVDGVVDVIDPATRELVVTQRMDKVVRLIGGNLATMRREGEYGEQIIEVYRVRINR